jgi:hypothetical protein
MLTALLSIYRIAALPTKALALMTMWPGDKHLGTMEGVAPLLISATFMVISACAISVVA